MPLRMLSQDEMSTLVKRKTGVELTKYETELRDLAPGAWAELVAEDGVSMRALKRRYTLASKNLGINLRYKTSGEQHYVTRHTRSTRRGDGPRRGRKPQSLQ